MPVVTGFAGDLELGDNNKLACASSDLQFTMMGAGRITYRNGNLILQGSSAIVFNAVTNGDMEGLLTAAVGL